MAKRKHRQDGPRAVTLRKYRQQIREADTWQRLEDIVGSIDRACVAEAVYPEDVEKLCKLVADKASEIEEGATA